MLSAAAGLGLPTAHRVVALCRPAVRWVASAAAVPDPAEPPPRSLSEMPAVPAYPLVGSMPALSSLERRHPPLKVANELDQLLLLLYKEKVSGGIIGTD